VGIKPHADRRVEAYYLYYKEDNDKFASFPRDVKDEPSSHGAHCKDGSADDAILPFLSNAEMQSFTFTGNKN